jgi:dolichol-phosphate mannosyltransferase
MLELELNFATHRRHDKKSVTLPSAPSTSIVVPTFREVEALPELIDRVGSVRAANGSIEELVIVDDDSRDGTEALIAARPEPWLKLIVRKEDRGLSQAVLAGLRAARGDLLVVMDADLSHPPEVIADMQGEILAGADFVVGSRYVPGGTTADDWGFFRFLNSQIATALARPLGYKIGLELLVRCGCENVREIPIHFANRTRGESKLTVEQQLLYVRHLIRLYRFKLGI